MGKRNCYTTEGKKKKRRYRQQETHAWWQTYPVSFGERERGRGEATKNKATRWKHSFGSYYLSSYTVTFVLLL